MMGDQRGSAAIEAVLVAPVLLALVALLIGGGRVTSAQAALAAVAREAGRVAVTAPTPEEAVAWGQMRAREVAAGYQLDPSRLRVSIRPGAFARGGDVFVEATYSVGLSDLPSLGLIPGAASLTATHVEPIDAHISR
ncbi:MAG: TadE/TadG family type IV pilus assembly protein [Thermoleophilaceae bacterium]